MAGLNIDLNKNISVGSLSRGKMPTKTTINLVPKKERYISTPKGKLTTIIAAVIILLLIFLLIVRPVMKLTKARAQVADLTTQLDQTNSQIAQLAGLEEEYAHYTYEDMTTEEMSRVSRVKVMRLVQEALIDGGVANSWSLSGNVMTLQVSGASLSQLNQIAAALEQEDIVERCVINSANKGGENVAVSFVIYLVKPVTDEPDTAVDVADTTTDAETAGEEANEQ